MTENREELPSNWDIALDRLMALKDRIESKLSDEELEEFEDIINELERLQ